MSTPAPARSSRWDTLREDAKAGATRAAGGDPGKPTPTPRADITAKGVAMIGDLRTDALHQALREAPIGDDVLIGMLVLALGGRNVKVDTGAEGRGYGFRERIAEQLTEGGVLTQDLDLLRSTAREMLVQVLSCRDNRSQSGMGARYAGMAIGADECLPNMATEEFLSCLSKAAMERTGSANDVAPRNTGKQTRAAMIAKIGDGRFVHPAALFPPNAIELQARRKPSSLIVTEGEEDPDLDSDAEDLDGADLSGEVEDGPDAADMPLPGHGDLMEHQAAA